MNKFVLGCILTALICTSGCEKSSDVLVYEDGTEWKQTETASEWTESVEEEIQTETVPANIYVYVCGAVRNPGVVEVPAGTRVFEVLEKAGGFTEDAYGKAVNQAAEAVDGQQIIVPTLTEAETWSREEVISGTNSGEANGKVNLNEAQAQELMTLPGIGEAKAADIIAYRETVGRFQTIEDIKNISGIKDAVFEKIKDKIMI